MEIQGGKFAPPPVTPPSTIPQEMNSPGAKAQEQPGQKKFSEVWEGIQQKQGTAAPRRELKKQLGKDDFVRIMMEQLKHQDPLKPMDADKMAQELAQLGSMEQLQNINQKLEKLSSGNQPLEKLAMTNLIGKSIVVDPTNFILDQNSSHTVNFPLKQAVESMHLFVRDSSGNTLYEEDLGKKMPGNVEWKWDGRLSAGGKAEPGQYRIVLDAKDPRGQPVTLSLRREERVSGVSYEGKEPLLLVGSGKSISKIPMSTVSGISDPSSVSATSSLPNSFPRVNSGESPSQQLSRVPVVPVAQQNFIPMSQQQEPEAPSAPSEGFPNGLEGGG